MTPDEVRALLRFKDQPLADCGEVNSLLDEHIGYVAARIRELRGHEKELRSPDAFPASCAARRPCAKLQRGAMWCWK